MNVLFGPVSVLLVICLLATGCEGVSSEDSVIGHYTLDQEATEEAQATFKSMFAEAHGKTTEQLRPDFFAQVASLEEEGLYIRGDGTFGDSTGRIAGRWIREVSMLSLTDTVEVRAIIEGAARTHAMRKSIPLMAAGETAEGRRVLQDAVSDISEAERKSILRQHSGLDCEVQAATLLCAVRYYNSSVVMARLFSDLSEDVKKAGLSFEEIYGRDISGMDAEAISAAVSQPALIFVKER